MGKRVRFYADEHVPAAVVKGLRLHGADVLTTAEAGMLGAPDEAQLAFAAQTGRVMCTQDADFLRLHQAGTPHAGIVYARQGHTVGEIVRGLLLLHAVLDRESMVNAVEFV